jgi:hypothetical protein
MSPEGALPTLHVPMSTQAILERLSTMSKRGRLDGFEANPTSPEPGLFAAAALGTPFDSVMIARQARTPGDPSLTTGSSSASGPSPTGDSAASSPVPATTLEFEIHMTRKLPMIFAAALIFTVWPGVALTDMFIADWFPSLWRLGITYYWYLPLAILSVPFAWRAAMKRSRETARQYAVETIDAIGKELGVDSSH